MSRYIDADKLEQFLHRDEWGTPDECWRPEREFGKFIDAIQTAEDVIEVVRCKDCKFNATVYLADEVRTYVSYTHCVYFGGDCFCCYGERKDK